MSGKTCRGSISTTCATTSAPGSGIRRPLAPSGSISGISSIRLTDCSSTARSRRVAGASTSASGRHFRDQGLQMRFLRRTALVIVFLLTLIVGTTAAVIIVTQTAWFKDWLRGYIVRQANLYLNGQITIGRLGGNLFYGVEMERIGISMDGSEVVSVQDLGLNYSVFELISKGMSVDTIRLNHPLLYLRHDGDGWSIARLIKLQEQEADRQGPELSTAIRSICPSDASVA